MFHIILGTFGVAMARHGLILSQDGATSLRNVFKYLLGLWDAISRPKNTKKTQKKSNKKKKKQTATKNVNSRIF